MSVSQGSRISDLIFQGSLIGDLATYTTRGGAEVIHRHLVSGGWAYPIFTRQGEKWEVRFVDDKLAVGPSPSEAEAVLFLVEESERKVAAIPEQQGRLEGIAEIYQDFDRARTLRDIEARTLRDIERWAFNYLGEDA